MDSNNNSINKITFMNICSTILLQGITFFTAPVFTRILGAEQYGKYSVFSSWSVIFSCIMGFGVGSTLATGKYQFRELYYEFRSSILLLGTVLCMGISLLGVLFIKPLSILLGYSPWIIILLFASAFSHFIIGFAQGVYIYEKEAGKNFILSIMLSICSVVLSIVLILKFPDNHKFMGRVFGSLVSYIVAAGIVWCTIYLKKPIGIKKEYCQFALIVGLPTVFHTLAHNILTQSDRVMMWYMGISDTEIGIYSIYYTFSGVMSTILHALNTSWCPFYYDDVDTKNWKVLNKKCKHYIELFTIITFGFLLLSREVGYILAGKEFWSGIDSIPIIVLSVYFTFMYQFPVNFEFFHKKTKIIAIGTLGAAMVNIFLNWAMIPQWGMYGAAIATALSYGVLFIFHYQIAAHMKEQAYHLKLTIFIPGVIVIGIGMALFYILANKWYIRWLLGALLGSYELWKIIKRKTIF